MPNTLLRHAWRRRPPHNNNVGFHNPVGHNHSYRNRTLRYDQHHLMPGRIRIRQQDPNRGIIWRDKQGFRFRGWCC